MKTTTALVIVGVGIGAAAIWKMKGGTLPRASKPAAVVDPLYSILGGLIPGFVKGLSSNTGAIPSGSSVDTSAQAAYGASHGVLDVDSSGHIIDLNTGNYVSG